MIYAGFKNRKLIGFTNIFSVQLSSLKTMLMTLVI